MNFTIQREELLPPLQLVAGIVERKQASSMLANVLIVLDKQNLSLLGTDSEVELIGKLSFPSELEAIIAVSTKKLLDICRALPESSKIDFLFANQRVTVKSGRSRFVISTFEAKDFPYIEMGTCISEMAITEKDFRYLLEKIQFSMAQQDVRYYLNGLLLEANRSFIKAVATDGHRLSISLLNIINNQNIAPFQILIPRKAVIELLRLLDGQSEEQIKLMIGSNHFRVSTKQYTFTTRLIDGQFPAYDKVIPKNNDKQILIQKDLLKQALNRVAILANTKLRGVLLQLRQNLLKVNAQNLEQEVAEEELPIEYSGPDLDIGVNVSYLLDVINVASVEQIRLSFLDNRSSILIEECSTDSNLYIIMPMRV